MLDNIDNIIFLGVMFPSIPLMMVNFGNRYAVVAQLIRHLHDEMIHTKDISKGDGERFVKQIGQLRHRLRLIGMCQTLASFAFILTLGALIAVYFENTRMASQMFFGTIVSMTLSMILFTWEIRVANTALDVHLSDLEERQEWIEWQKYLAPRPMRPMRRKRKTPAKKQAPKT